jgi:hypothetical protein
MGKLRTYLVSFNPAERGDRPGAFSVAITVGLGDKPAEVTAGDFVTLESEVRKLAAAWMTGKTYRDKPIPACSAYVRVRRGERNPPGFDRWTNTLRIIDATAAAVRADKAAADGESAP